MRLLSEWSVAEVADFLEMCRPKIGAKVDHYKQLFIEQDIDGEVLNDVGDEELNKLGISSFGHRHYILKSLQTIKGSSAGSTFTNMSMASEGSSGGSQGLMGSAGGMDRESASMMPPPPLGIPRSSPNQGSVPSGVGPMGLGGMAGPGLGPGMGMPGMPGMPGMGGGMPGMRPGMAPNLFMHEDRSITHISKPAMPRLHQSTPRIHESKVTIGVKIGSGSVGHVYAGKYEQHPVAIKQHKLDGTQLDAKALQEFEIEVGKMTAVNHPCIVRCYGMLEPTPGMVLELVEGGSLFQIIHARRDESFTAYQLRLPWPVRMRYLLDSMYGLRAVHAAGLIHGDFKTLNMLVGPDQRVKVGDFGLSKCLGALSVLPGTKTITGTPQYMAPEVMQSQPQGMRVDIYSVGIVMWELLTGEIPWKGMDIVQIIQQVTLKANETQKPPPGRPRVDNIHLLSAPAGYIQLMKEAWAQNPNDRPSTDSCVQQLEAVQQSHGLYPSRDSSSQLALHSALLAQESIRHQDKKPRLFPAGGQTPSIFGTNTMSGGSNMSGMAHGGIPSQYEALLKQPMGAPQVRQPQWNPPGASGLNPPPIFLAAGGMDVLVDMLNEKGDEAGQVQAAGAVFEACANNPYNQATLYTAGGMPAMVDLLNRVDKPELQAKAAQAIAAACGSNADNRMAVINAAGVRPLVRMLQSHHSNVQENAANALANIVKARKPRDGSRADGPADPSEIVGMRDLAKYGGVEALIDLIRTGTPRVKEAATAAIANAMEDSSETRNFFQAAGGIELVLNLLKSGDPHAQENATTALWNAMVDNEMSRIELIKNKGMPLLIQQLVAGTAVGQELAAGAIWKSCANDPSLKEEAKAAIPGLVALLRTGTDAAKEHAAGALRSACINSAPNKAELNRVNGIAALMEVIQSGGPRAREQAGAALANACANSIQNQTAARHANAIKVLVGVISDTASSTEMLECAIAAIRNLCVNSEENQEELNRCGGVHRLLLFLSREIQPQLLEYTIGALWKACTHSESNRNSMLANGLGVIQSLAADTSSQEVARAAAGLLQLLHSHSSRENSRENSGEFSGEKRRVAAEASEAAAAAEPLEGNEDEEPKIKEEEVPPVPTASKAETKFQSEKIESVD